MWNRRLVAQETESPFRPNRRHIVFYGDCCSGVPGEPAAAAFARVNAGLSSLEKKPDFIVFLGDHIKGYSGSVEELTEQWHHWLNVEMAWLNTRLIPVHHITSNHNTYDAESEARLA